MGTDTGFTSGDSGNSNGSVESPVSQSPSTGMQQDTQQQQPADNPAWNPLLEAIPIPEFRDKAKPILRQWDDNYRQREAELNQLREQYEPYKSYVGVDPQAINYALGLLQQVQQNPVAVMEALQEHARQQGLLKDTPANQAPQDLSEDPNADPRFTELERRQQEIDQRTQEFEQWRQEQAYNASVSNYENEINEQVGEIRKQFGNAVDVQDLLQRMYMQLQRGEEFSAAAAFEEQRATYQRMYANLGQNGNGRHAPNVLTPGGQPAPNMPQKDPKDMNESERKAYFKQLLDAANAGG